MQFLSLSFLAGVYTATLINVTSPLLPMAIFSCGLVVVALRKAACFGVFLAGILYTIATATDSISLRLPQEFAGDSLVMRVVVLDFPAAGDGLIRFTALPVSGSRRLSTLILNWYEPPVSVRIGDEWQLELRLRQPHGHANPGAPDTEARALSRSVAATGYVVNGPRNRLLAAANSRSIPAIRQGFVDKIHAALPMHPSAPVLVALSVGSRHLFTADHWRDFAASGTAHLVAISGLHIGLIAFFCALLGRGLLLFCRCNQRRWALLAGLSGAACYLMVSGTGLPAQRAFIMLSVAVACLLMKRRLRASAILAFAAVSIALGNPLSISEPGLWLSFAAVASLFWWSARQAYAPAGRSWIAALWSAQLMLFFALLPVTGLIFGRLSLSAPVANLLAVPIFSFVAVPATLGGVLLPAAFEPVLKLAAFAVDLVAAVVERLEHIEPLVVPSGLFVLVAAAALFAVCLPVGFPGRLCSLCAIPVVLYPGAHGPAPGCLWATFFDVGQGTSILVETRHHSLLYDTGPPYGTSGSAFEAQVAPALERLGVRALDRIIVSHADADHAGGIHAAIERYPDADVMVGEPLNAVDALPCFQDQAWLWDAVLFEVIHPARNAAFQGNDRSCVLRVSSAGSTLLLTGDIEAAAEADLLGRMRTRADVISMPHHGSRTSSTLPFVAATSPHFALVSAGYENRFGHPKDDIVARWEAQSSIVLNTSQSGAIRVGLCANEPPDLLGTSRDGRRKLWHGSNMGGL